MPLPILPGLMGAPAASPDAAPPPAGEAMPKRIDDLTEEEFKTLLAASKGEAPAEGEGDAAPGGEVDEEAQAKAEAETIAGTAVACAAEISESLEQMNALLAQAEEAEDGDPKAIKKLLKEAEGIADDCTEAADAAKAAAEEGDVDEATKQSELCEGHAAEMNELLAKAQEAAGTAPAPAAGAPPPPAAAAAKSPLEVWMNRAR